MLLAGRFNVDRYTWKQIESYQNFMLTTMRRTHTAAILDCSFLHSRLSIVQKRNHVTSRLPIFCCCVSALLWLLQIQFDCVFVCALFCVDFNCMFSFHLCFRYMTLAIWCAVLVPFCTDAFGMCNTSLFDMAFLSYWMHFSIQDRIRTYLWHLTYILDYLRKFLLYLLSTKYWFCSSFIIQYYSR